MSQHGCTFGGGARQGLAGAAVLTVLVLLGIAALGAGPASAFPNNLPTFSYVISPATAGALDMFADTSVTSRGAIYVTGEVVRRGSADLVLARVGTHGWRKYYDGPAHGTDEGCLVYALQRGGAYVAGISPSRSGLRQLVVARYAGDGRRLWLHRHTTRGGAEDTAAEIAVDSAGSVYVAGTTGNRTLLVKYTPSGRTAWTKTWGRAGSAAKVFDLEAAPDGSLYLCGALETTSGASADGLLLKYRADGSSPWVRRYSNGGPTSYSVFYAVCRRPAGGVIAVGMNALEGPSAGWALATRYTSAGALRTMTVYPTTMTALDAYEDVVVDRNGLVDVCGKLTDGGVQRFAVRQLDDAFTEQWTYTTDAGQDGGAAYELMVDPSGRPCALGVVPLLDWATPRDAPSLVALGADGAERWIYRHPGGIPGDSYLWSLARYRTSNVYACGMQPNASGGYDAALFGWGL